MSARKLKAPALTPLEEVTAWNAKHPVGTPVRVTRDDGSTWDTLTRSRAAVLSDHTAVVWLAGRVGCYLLSRVKPRKFEPPAKAPPS